MYRRRRRILKKVNKANIECCQQQLRKSKNQKKILARKTTIKRAKEKWQIQMEDSEGDQDLAS